MSKKLIINLPSQLDASAIRQLAQVELKKIDAKKPKIIEIRSGELKFVKPAGVTFLANFFEYLIDEKELEVVFDHLNIKNSAIKYLDDALFFEEFLDDGKLDQSSQLRKTIFPLEKIDGSRAHNWKDSRLLPWLCRALNMQAIELGSLSTAIMEILNNVKDHSTKNNYFCFAQHYPSQKKIEISIADFGIGIPKTIGKKFRIQTDTSAIVKATKEGVSAKSTKRNQGIGLFHLIRYIVDNKYGSVSIYSLEGAVRFERVGNRRHSTDFEAGFCPGTTIEISLDTSRFVGDFTVEEEDIEW